MLADDSGHTVYMFAKDEAGKSYCAGVCASVWVPVATKSMPAVEDGLNPRMVTLLKREGGLMQVVYNGHPLLLPARHRQFRCLRAATRPVRRRMVCADPCRQPGRKQQAERR